MLIPKSGRWTVPEPPPLRMERVSELKILGVLFTNDLSVTSHVDDIISKCASSTYALRILRSNGLQDNALFTVCNAPAISRLLYAAPVERCADVIVWGAARRSISFGGGGAPPVKKNWRRLRRGVGDQKHFF